MRHAHIDRRNSGFGRVARQDESGKNVVRVGYLVEVKVREPAVLLNGPAKPIPTDSQIYRKPVCKPPAVSDIETPIVEAEFLVGNAKRYVCLRYLGGQQLRKIDQPFKLNALLLRGQGKGTE